MTKRNLKKLQAAAHTPAANRKRSITMRKLYADRKAAEQKQAEGAKGTTTFIPGDLIASAKPAGKPRTTVRLKAAGNVREAALLQVIQTALELLRRP